MHYRLIQLRAKGVPLTRSKLESIEPGYLLVLDHLELAGNMKPRRFSRVAYFVAPSTNNTRRQLARPIFDPEIVSASESELLIAGIELDSVKDQDKDLLAEHAQVWRLEVITPPAERS